MSCMLTLNDTLIYPHLIYANIVWANTKKTNCEDDCQPFQTLMRIQSH